jgi:hypothetical protein
MFLEHRVALDQVQSLRVRPAIDRHGGHGPDRELVVRRNEQRNAVPHGVVRPQVRQDNFVAARGRGDDLGVALLDAVDPVGRIALAGEILTGRDVLVLAYGVDGFGNVGGERFESGRSASCASVAMDHGVPPCERRGTRNRPAVRPCGSVVRWRLAGFEPALRLIDLLTPMSAVRRLRGSALLQRVPTTPQPPFNQSFR